MDKIVRVAQIVGDMVGGGVEAVVMNYYRHIDRTKVQFDFIIHDTSTHVPQGEIEGLGGRIFYVPNYKKLSSYKRALLKIFKENNYDIVHSHMNTLSVFPLKIAKKAGVKVRISHSHSTSNKKEWKRNIIKNLLRPFSKKYATQYFACSEFAGRWLFGDKAFDNGEVTIINNAIDIEKFKFNNDSRETVRKELNIKNKFVIGHIGRFMQQKNHSFLIDIFNGVLKNREDAVLLLLGDGPLMEEINAKVNALGITEKVMFMGNLANPEKYYNAMDCFVLPSLYEGLPVVGIEAQMNGLSCFFSSEMTKETKLLNTTEFLTIDLIEMWVDKIIRLENNERYVAYELLKNSKFSINHEASKLERFYLDNVNGL